MTGRIKTMRERTVRWLYSMEVPGRDGAVFTNSEHNRDQHNPGMLLAATYNALNCLILLGEHGSFSRERLEKTVRYLKGHLGDDGFYKMEGMKKEDVYYPTMEYINFHITNYVMGALAGLGVQDVSSFAFLDEYSTPRKLDRWLSRREMGNPWTEGNYIVNLASFYLFAMERMDRKKYGRLLYRLFDWHRLMQDPETGYWFDPAAGDLTSAMAGAAHNLHIYYYLNKPLPRYKKIIDHCLTFPGSEVSSACIDIDIADILCHLIKYRYREEEIRAFLSAKLDALLDYQNNDGGFSDTVTGTRLFDGWEVYREPQGISNCFAAWFRSASIGMIASVLYPETRGWWQFRNTIGMGYYNSRYLEGIDPEQVLPRKIRKPKRIWLKAYGRKPEGSVPEEVPGLSTEELSERVRDAFNGKDLSGFTDPAVFAFKIPNRDDAGFAVRIENGTAAVSKDPSGADITITISEKNLLKILNGKLMPVVGYATKRLKINGDMGLALKLQNLF